MGREKEKKAAEYPVVKSKEELDSFPYKPDSIKVVDFVTVSDLVATYREDGFHYGYDFIIFGIKCHSNYPWAFWEITPENQIKINEFIIENEKLKEQKKKVSKIRKQIKDLSNT